MSAARPARRGLRRLFRADLGEIVDLAAKPKWAFPAIVGLGVLSSLAEAFGVGLVVLFLYSAMGRVEEAAAAGGALGPAFAAAAAYLPSPVYIAPAILLAIMLKAGFSASYTLFSAYMQNRLGKVIRDRLHQNYLEVEYDHIRKREEGEMLNVLAIESFSVSAAYGAVSRIVVGAAAVTVMLALLFAISWQLTAAAIVGSAIVFVALNLLSAPVRRLGRRATEVNQDMAARMLHTLQGMRAIRAFSQEKHHQQAFESASDEACRVSMRMAQLGALLAPFAEVGYLCLLAVIVALASTLSTPFAITLACVALLYRMQTPIRDVQKAVIELAEIEAPLRSVADALRRSDKRYPPQGWRAFSTLERGVEFRDVDFSYAPAPTKALDGASFTIPAGRTTAIVGPSGAGKTTIVNLLLRLDEPDAGAILVDGAPLRDLRRADWLERVALAGQDVELMDSTVGANISVARADASEAELREAARLAGLLDVIDALEFGMEHWIGPQGANFSGGQRQRLGIARAILRDPHILILDEATSALDARLEDSVRHNLRARFAGRTVVIITHRLDTIASVDHVVCVRDGRIAEQGAPAELLSRNSSAFRAMLERKSAPGDDVALAARR